MSGLDPGRLIGSCRVVRCVGRGGMGTVYKVEHLDLGVRYALKTFSFDPADGHAEILKANFLEDGKLLAWLKHSNLTHVFDLAYDEASESLYFAGLTHQNAIPLARVESRFGASALLYFVMDLV